MKLPTRVKIIAHDYEVQQLPDELMHENMGFCNSVTQQIHVGLGLSATQEAETLVHEILHAVFYHLSLKGNAEEQIVNGLSLGFVAVLRDNPHLWKYLSETLK